MVLRETPAAYICGIEKKWIPRDRNYRCGLYSGNYGNYHHNQKTTITKYHVQLPFTSKGITFICWLVYQPFQLVPSCCRPAPSSGNWEESPRKMNSVSNLVRSFSLNGVWGQFRVNNSAHLPTFLCQSQARKVSDWYLFEQQTQAHIVFVAFYIFYISNCMNYIISHPH